MDLRSTSLAWVLCGAQIITTAMAALIAWMVSGKEASVAALFGGAVAIAPAAYFATYIHLRGRGSQAGEILGGFYRAELGKLLLTALLFFIGALLFGKHFAPLMLTCMACLAMNWLMLAVASSE